MKRDFGLSRYQQLCNALLRSWQQRLVVQPERSLTMDLEQTVKMFDHLNAAIVAANADFKVVYQNEKCRELFKLFFGQADYIGCDINDCHPPEAAEKVEQYYREYAAKERVLDYYTVNDESVQATVVNVPYYDGDIFKGVVEFIFESSLA